MSNDKKRNSGIYLITNLVNKKIYIGSAVYIKGRFAKHKSSLKLNKHHNIHLQRAYNKYGENAFDYYILELVDDKNKLIEREQAWLDIFNPEYNIRKIADNNTGLTWKLNKEIKLKFSKIHKGKQFSEEHRKALSKALSGKKKATEHVAKMKATKKGKPWTEARWKAQEQLKLRKHDTPTVH